MTSLTKTEAALTLVKSMDDYELANFIEQLGEHCHGYDLNAVDVAERMREDAETPRQRDAREREARELVA